MRVAAVTWQYPISPDGEVGRGGVYWLALGPSARTSGGRLGTATLLLLLVAVGVLSHTLTFECVGQCSWKVLNCHRDAVLVHRREPSAASPICTRAVVASETDVLVTLLAIERASDYDLIQSSWPSSGAQWPGAAPDSLSQPC